MESRDIHAIYTYSLNPRGPWTSITWISLDSLADGSHGCAWVARICMESMHGQPPGRRRPASILWPAARTCPRLAPYPWMASPSGPALASCKFRARPISCMEALFSKLPLPISCIEACSIPKFENSEIHYEISSIEIRSPNNFKFRIRKIEVCPLRGCHPSTKFYPFTITGWLFSFFQTLVRTLGRIPLCQSTASPVYRLAGLPLRRPTASPAYHFAGLPLRWPTAGFASTSLPVPLPS